MTFTGRKVAISVFQPGLRVATREHSRRISDICWSLWFSPGWTVPRLADMFGWSCVQLAVHQWITLQSQPLPPMSVPPLFIWLSYLLHTWNPFKRFSTVMLNPLAASPASSTQCVIGLCRHLLHFVCQWRSPCNRNSDWQMLFRTRSAGVYPLLKLSSRRSLVVLQAGSALMGVVTLRMGVQQNSTGTWMAWMNWSGLGNSWNFQRTWEVLRTSWMSFGSASLITVICWNVIIILPLGLLSMQLLRVSYWNAPNHTSLLYLSSLRPSVTETPSIPLSLSLPISCLPVWCTAAISGECSSWTCLWAGGLTPTAPPSPTLTPSGRNWRSYCKRWDGMRQPMHIVWLALCCCFDVIVKCRYPLRMSLAGKRWAMVEKSCARVVWSSHCEPHPGFRHLAVAEWPARSSSSLAHCYPTSTLLQWPPFWISGEPWSVSMAHGTSTTTRTCAKEPSKLSHILSASWKPFQLCLCSGLVVHEFDDDEQNEMWCEM